MDYVRTLGSWSMLNLFILVGDLVDYESNPLDYVGTFVAMTPILLTYSVFGGKYFHTRNGKVVPHGNFYIDKLNLRTTKVSMGLGVLSGGKYKVFSHIYTKRKDESEKQGKKVAMLVELSLK